MESQVVGVILFAEIKLYDWVSGMAKIMSADALATDVARASADMMLTKVSISVPTL